MYILWRPENANPVLATFLALCRSIYTEGSATSHAMRASINIENTMDDAP
jgi:hypothetical protein